MLALLLCITLWKAFLLEVGFIAFFLFYTYVFNQVQDILRVHLFEHEERHNRIKLHLNNYAKT
ncbi:chlorhexidine efflux transporter [Providencia rettgeri]|uniref:chlorhexidine efflux transporter n=1 Tax=Providencia rettgeri TaxID=587 RepID=UPI0034E0B58B